MKSIFQFWIFISILSGITAYTYLGCFYDKNGDRVWHANIHFHNTIDKCTTYCRSIDKRYAGAEYGEECFCGDTYPHKGPATNCNFGCKGDDSKKCGGIAAMSVYFVCSNGTYKSSDGGCGNTCDCSNVNIGCHQISGECESECINANFKGPQCSECADGKYGSNCEESCNVNCAGNNDPCDSVTGKCTNGCGNGWLGEYCTTPCNYGKYGWNCGSTCGHCKNNVTCNHIDGKCLDGCAAGWMDVMCDEACDPGKYGSDCADSCSEHCKDGDICNKETGICPNGCGEGWTNPKCDQDCGSGTYGLNCGNTCSATCKSGACHHVSGSCTDGCLLGWEGDQCGKECTGMSYGQDCSSICSSNCVSNDVCDHVTGVCPNGCKDGWQGSHCNSKCTGMSYGQDCSNTCSSNCANDDTCHHVTGVCPNGCKEGWQGSHCNSKCPDGFYGGSCDKPCGNCLHGSSCDSSDGNCPQGCEPGYKDDLCQNECDNGTYGVNCALLCGNCTTAVCNITDGSCLTTGCHPGWRGESCDQVCQSGTYGLECNDKCGHCDGLCDPIDGTCGNDTCLPGYQGHLCIEECVEGTYGHICEEKCECESNKCDHINGTCLTATNRGDSNNGVPAAAIGIAVGSVILLLVPVIFIFILRKKRDAEEEEGDIIFFDNIGGEMQSSTTTEPIVLINPMTETQTQPDEENMHENNDFRLKIDEIGAYIKKQKSDKSGFKNEFKGLPTGQTAPWLTAVSPKNLKAKNRYTRIYAYDHSRVHLKSVQKGQNSDYINANFIDGYKSENKFIATQGPKNTSSDLWTMIWEQNVIRIVMVTNLKEGDTNKCEQYWPNLEEEKSFENITVKNTKEVEMPGFITRTLQIYKAAGGSDATYEEPSRCVLQFHFTEWPDKGVPKHGTAILNFVRHLKEENKGIKAPIVVHCSAGIGRTGTFIALDHLLDQAEAEKMIDVFSCVKAMRQKRLKMVQTLGQYVFIYDTIYEAVMVGDTRIQCSEFDQVYSSMKSVNTDSGVTRLEEQYQVLKTMASDIKSEKRFKAALDPENKNKNRSQDVLPDDRHRMFLSMPFPDGNQYINAVLSRSYIKSNDVILTQLPLVDTVVDFWRLVQDFKVVTIVTLTRYQYQECRDITYWPAESDTVVAGPFTITRKDMKREGATVCSHLVFEYENTSRDIFLVGAVDWPEDKWKPNNESTFHDLYLKIKTWQQKQRKDQNLIIQCLDGGMNSGMYAVVSWMFDMIRAEQAVDIFQITKQIVTVRPETLTTKEQYEDLYTIAENYMKNFQTYSNV